MSNFRALAALVCLALSGAAYPQGNVSVGADQMARLEAGERVQVLVWIDDQAAADAGLLTAENRGETRDAFPDGALARVFERVLGYSATQMRQPANGVNRPELLYSGRYTPVAAMSLTADEIARLAADPLVARIETDALYTPMLPVSRSLTGADIVHAAGEVGEGVSIAILDTGVDHQHAAFADSIVESACFSASASGNAQSFCPAGAGSDVESEQAGDNCEEADGLDGLGAPGCGHGTHVAGIALGRSFPSTQLPDVDIIGMAPGAGLVAVQVFSRFVGEEYCGYDGACPLSYVSNQLAALEWLYDNRERLNLAAVNMSLGGGEEPFFCPTHPLATIIGRLHQANISTVVSSGNEGFQDAVSAPGCISEAVTVGATQRGNVVTSFSNIGPTVDIYAPGVDIVSAQATDFDVGQSRSIAHDGTSMAAPHVAGAIALLRAHFPDVSQDALEYALFSTAESLYNNYNRNMGARFLRVDRAYDFLSENAGGRAGGAVVVSPLEGFEAVAQILEQESFGRRKYTLTNTSNAPAGWSVRSDQAWIRFSTTENEVPAGTTASGTLQAGGSIDLWVGLYPDGQVGAGQYVGESQIESGAATHPLRFTVLATIFGRVPFNDNFENAIPTIGFLNGGGSGHTQYATVQDGEPQHGGRQGYRSLWWRWTPTQTLTVELQSYGPGAGDDATMIAVYQGADLSDLTEVHSGPVFGGGTPIDVVAGEEYYIVLSNVENVYGQVSFGFRAYPDAPNAHFSQALELPGNSGSMIAYNATGEVRDFDRSPTGQTLRNNAWFSWTPTVSGTGRVSFPGGIEMYLQAFRPPVGEADPERIASASTLTVDPFTLEFPVTAGETYLISHGYAQSGYHAYSDIAWSVSDDEIVRLRYALLPAARSAVTGGTVTVLMSVVNPPSARDAATNCRIFGNSVPSNVFNYWATDPATNASVGDANPVFDIPVGGVRTFAVAESFYSSRGRRSIWPRVLCDGAIARRTAGFNQAQIAVADFPTPDVVAIGATLSGDGIVSAAAGNWTAYSVAALNLGVAGPVTVSPYFWDSNRTQHEGQGLELEVCETNPTTGQCVTARVPDLDIDMARFETRTFTIFVRDQGFSPISFGPAQRRVFAHFWLDSRLVGATSAAYRTQE